MPADTEASVHLSTPVKPLAKTLTIFFFPVVTSIFHKVTLDELQSLSVFLLKNQSSPTSKGRFNF